MPSAQEPEGLVGDLEVALTNARNDLRAARQLITWLVQQGGLAERLREASDAQLRQLGLEPAAILLLRQFLRPLRNFSWLGEHRVAGLARPETREGIAALVAEGVGTVVTLTEDPLPAEWLEGSGLSVHHIPMVDFQGPELDELRRAVDVVEQALAQGHAVAVHCFAGRGRTGTVLAAFLVRRGVPPGEAIHTVRSLRPSSIESADQVDAVFAFAASAGWTGQA